jgi:K+/H+ antiporter YhaU regulatory subunit KhtT
MTKEPMDAPAGQLAAEAAAKAMEMALQLSKALDEIEQAIPDREDPEAKAMLAKFDAALGDLELWAKGHVLIHAPETDER